MSNSSDPCPEVSMTQAKKVIFKAGIKVRYEVLGKEYVDKALAEGSTPFARPLQELVTEAAWGLVWTRPGLERKQRSMLNLAMLCALNRPAELAIHVRGAMTNGVTEVEMSEVFLQVSIYCGMPAGIEGMKVAQRVFDAVKAEEMVV